ncbi:TPA: P fimbrial minor subunit PapE, partial [Escherichia coli]
MKKIRGLCLPVMLGAVLMSQHVHAVDNLTFRGKLIIPACTVSNTTVDWQDVEIQTLSQNGNHEKEFTVNMRCPYNLGTMKVTITATNTYNNAILVQNTSNTSSDGLLVYLYNSNAGNIGTAITLGAPFTPGKITGNNADKTISLHAKL